METKMKFKIGDIVYLKSRRDVKMAVKVYDGDPLAYVGCSWLDKQDRPCEFYFHEDQLEAWTHATIPARPRPQYSEPK